MVWRVTYKSGEREQTRLTDNPGEVALIQELKSRKLIRNFGYDSVLIEEFELVSTQEMVL